MLIEIGEGRCQVEVEVAPCFRSFLLQMSWILIFLLGELDLSWLPKLPFGRWWKPLKSTKGAGQQIEAHYNRVELSSLLTRVLQTKGMPWLPGALDLLWASGRACGACRDGMTAQAQLMASIL